MVTNIAPHVPLTRFDIENAYVVSPIGVIHTFGEFYGEMIYVPFFWDLAQNRKHNFVHTDEHKTIWLFAIVDIMMSSEFPELDRIREVGVSKQRRRVISWARSAYSPTLT